MFNFTSYYTYITTRFNCKGCCSKLPDVATPSEDEEVIDLKLEVHTHSHGVHRKRHVDTPRPQPVVRTLTLD